MRQLIQQHQQQEAAEQHQQQGAILEPAEQPHMPGRQQQQQQQQQQQRQTAGAGSPLHPNRQAKISNRQRLVEQTFKQLFKDELHTVIPVRNFQAVDELLRQWNADLQAYIQGRALLQLRLDRAAKTAAADGADCGGCCIGTSTRSSDASVGELHSQQQQQSAVGDVESGYLFQAGLTQTSSSSSPQRRPAAAQGLCVRTSSVSEAGASSSLEPRGPASLSAAGNSSATAAEGPAIAAAAAADVAAGEPCCRTPRLAPLKPRPVLPDEVAKGLKPRLVSKDKEEGTTAMGRCCASLAGALFGGPRAEEEEGAVRDDVGCVAKRLEAQRQALIDLEASILEAQKEVRWRRAIH
jgi:hypothetical protein